MSSLTDQCLQHVLSFENYLPADTQQWLDSQRLAEIVDDHVSYVGLTSTRASYVGQPTASGQGRYQSNWQNNFGSTENGGANFHKNDGHNPKIKVMVRGNNFGRRCTICQSMLHYKSKNLKRKGNGHLNTLVLPLPNRTVRETLVREQSAAHAAR